MNLNAAYPELLFNGNCITCHKTDNLNKSAPTVQEIQKEYKNAFADKKEFVDYMTHWVLSPKKETSLMQDKIEKYGLMPDLAYDESTLKEIAEYIYENKFSE
ncbi:MAG: cytochrome C [Arcobacter sp.]|uniref:Cytochrome C n=1 Tax=Poseidonibacter ostreae TaxID=2654171 RepID=A0A6L4WQZ1_9BACT|nr:cytochrome C [Poseidonibacter ostreae]KAB7885708.1 cytochrome C [Poseidonibacter ostreae]KAB7890412.1 cytochrome C [Poseidonibacter ostreae]MAC84509.1 cytochrome C [Arcobacter sp.]